MIDFIFLINEFVGLVIVPIWIRKFRKSNPEEPAEGVKVLSFYPGIRKMFFVVILLPAIAMIFGAMLISEDEVQTTLEVTGGVSLFFLWMWGDNYLQFHRTIILTNGVLEQGRSGNRTFIFWDQIEGVRYWNRTVYIDSFSSKRIKVYLSQRGVESLFQSLMENVSSTRWSNAYSDYRKKNNLI